MIPIRPRTRSSHRAGITLTEILISIMILGIGMVSLATLFPIGLLRLREAQRQTRSAFLAESAQAEMSARAMLIKSSFLNPIMSPWYAGPTQVGPPVLYYPYASYDPCIQDTPAAYQDWSGGADFVTPTAGSGSIANAGVYRGVGGRGTGIFTQVFANGANGAVNVAGAGLPIAYDPLWRYQTGTYLNPNLAFPHNFEARFASGIDPTSNTSFLRSDPDGGLPSAHGLQRLTNLGPVYGASILSSFVSPEDVVWQDPTVGGYVLAWAQQDPETKNVGFGLPLVLNPSPVVPDLSISTDRNNNPTFTPTVDFRYTWLFTGQQTDTTQGAFFDGNIVIMENRPFSVDPVQVGASTVNRVAGEIVVEAVFGYNANVAVFGTNTLGYGVASNRTVLLRWPASLPDPDVKVGSWIADVTYERQLATAATRFIPVPSVRGTMDNQPAQRCFWYQVAKITPPADATGTLSFAGDPVAYRYMMVWTTTDLRAKTVMNQSNGQPAVLNAALVSPHVVNVFPKTFTMK
jgi:type II secretory pathway pseudopilin PulG